MLIAVILQDTGSWLQARLSGWEYPVSREWIALSHLYDLTARVNAKSKPKPYPNPFPSKDKIRIGKTTKSFEQVRSILDWMNPKE